MQESRHAQRSTPMLDSSQVTENGIRGVLELGRRGWFGGRGEIGVNNLHATKGRSVHAQRIDTSYRFANKYEACRKCMQEEISETIASRGTEWTSTKDPFTTEGTRPPLGTISPAGLQCRQSRSDLLNSIRWHHPNDSTQCLP